MMPPPQKKHRNWYKKAPAIAEAFYVLKWKAQAICGYFTTMFTSLPGTTMDFTPEQVRGRLHLMPA